MSRKNPPAALANNVLLPVDAYLDLKAFHDELVGIAHTIDPSGPTNSSVRKHEQSRRRALARVFRLWAGQIERTLISIHQP
jgi:hypothetical protein